MWAHMGLYVPIYGPMWALMGPCMGPYTGPYGPLWAHTWAHMGPYGSSWTGLRRLRKLSENFPLDFWTNFARFGFKTEFFMKFLDDSASFLPQKLKNHVILTKNL